MKCGTKYQSSRKRCVPQDSRLPGHVLDKNTGNLYTHFSFPFQQKIRPHGHLNGNASVNSPCAQPPPPLLLRGICPSCQSLGWGICKFCTARGPGICQPPGHFRAFDKHAVSYQNITTQKVLLGKKQIGSSVKDRNKL